MPRDKLIHVVLDIFFCAFDVLLENDICTWVFFSSPGICEFMILGWVENLLGDAYDGCIGDGIKIQEDCFKLGRGDLVALDLDEFLIIVSPLLEPVQSAIPSFGLQCRSDCVRPHTQYLLS
jgi:hypothetical protein